jgi:uncharacterized protein (TIGR00297 family)
MATLAGKRVGGPAIPWNREKTLGGTLAFIVCGGLAGAVLAWWCRPVVTPLPEMWFTVGAPIVAAIVAALVETIPIRLDDNVSVTASAAATLWALSLVQEHLAHAAMIGGLSTLVVSCLVNIPVALAGWKAGTVTKGGAIGGALIGIAIAISTGWPGWVLLFATFAMATVCSRLGLRRKMLLGIAEDRGGRRGVGNAIANTGIAAVASVLSVLTASADAARVAFVAALAAGGSDTAASEIGKAWGQKTWLVPTFRRVPPGTSGAISLEGTIAGVAGAALLGGLGIALGLVPHVTILALVVGATIGSLAESVLGATLESSGVLNNDVLNFLNTGISAAVALFVDGLMR